MKKQKILFLASTHGDEGFSVPVLQALEKKYARDFSWLIANERARERNVRFTEVDLNRSAPGDPMSPLYEVRRAYELMQIAKSYDFVIDIHGTTAISGIYAIICNPTPINIAFAACLPVTNVVIWTDKTVQQSGPLTQFVSSGLEIECGPKNAPEIASELKIVLTKIIKEGLNINYAKNQRWYRVYGTLPKGFSGAGDLRYFQETSVSGETFFPLLMGQYHNVLCYKMERVDFNKFCLF